MAARGSRSHVEQKEHWSHHLINTVIDQDKQDEGSGPDVTRELCDVTLRRDNSWRYKRSWSISDHLLISRRSTASQQQLHNNKSAGTDKWLLIDPSQRYWWADTEYWFVPVVSTRTVSPLETSTRLNGGVTWPLEDLPSEEQVHHVTGAARPDWLEFIGVLMRGSGGVGGLPRDVWEIRDATKTFNLEYDTIWSVIIWAQPLINTVSVLIQRIEGRPLGLITFHQDQSRCSNIWNPGLLMIDQHLHVEFSPSPSPLLSSFLFPASCFLFPQADDEC